MLENEYDSLALVATVSTAFIVFLSSLVKRTPILINFVILLVILVAIFVYSSILEKSIIDTFGVLVSLVLGSTWIRLVVIAFWILMVAVSIGFCAYVRSVGSSSTIHRKFFHLTVSLIYISGLLLDHQFSWLCAWLWLSIFVIVEVLRFHNVPPWGPPLNDHLLIFKDEQDSALLLTPIYLLMGIFSPLMVSRHVFISHWRPALAHFAGVAAVGVGDSFAAIVGSKLGKTKWPNSKKSIEGTLAMFSSMLIFLLITNHFIIISASSSSAASSTTALFLASLSASLIEAFAQSMDNILLPIITYLIL